MNSHFRFELQHVDAGCAARASTFHTPHGAVDLPTFMPVGTCATVKGLTPDLLHRTGSRMILANTYHLLLRPGEVIIRELGGLHEFMQWSGPILTDSGGFQLVSLAERTRVTDEEAIFRSHIDGQTIRLSPERAIAIQEALGSDVAMVLDHVVPLPASREVLADAARRTRDWAQRCRQVATRQDQALFGIVQGGLDPELRAWSVESLRALDFPGYAVGGLSVGESPLDMYRVLDSTVPLLPADRPRYLMGVGTPRDLLEGIGRGIDMFDCVMPTRNGRNALAFTDRGNVRLRNLRFANERRPLDEQCPCAACRHSCGYLRHLFMAREMLGPILVSVHNLTYYQRLVADARQAILHDQFESFRRRKLAGWEPPSD